MCWPPLSVVHDSLAFFYVRAFLSPLKARSSFFHSGPPLPRRNHRSCRLFPFFIRQYIGTLLGVRRAPFLSIRRLPSPLPCVRKKHAYARLLVRSPFLFSFTPRLPRVVQCPPGSPKSIAFILLYPLWNSFPLDPVSVFFPRHQ